MESTKIDVKEEPFLVWDTYDIAQSEAEFLIENQESEDERELTQDEKDEILDAVYNTSDYFTDAWDSEMEYLTERMKEINQEGCWFVEVVGFGWRGTSGASGFEALDGEALMEKILPKTDNIFKIFERVENGEKYFALNNFHHDSPTGKEWYYIYPAMKCGKCGDIKVDKYMHNDDDYDILCDKCKGDMDNYRKSIDKG